MLLSQDAAGDAVIRCGRHTELQSLADVVSAFRKAFGYSQEGFANESDLDRGFVGAVERGERNIGFRKVRRLLLGLGITWRDFGAALHEIDPLPTRDHLLGGPRARMPEGTPGENMVMEFITRNAAGFARSEARQTPQSTRSAP